MNIARLTSPDFALGKALMSAKSVKDLAVLLLAQPNRTSLRIAQLILRLKPFYTMATNRNLTGLYLLMRHVAALRLPGDVVECGVWNGGSAAILAAAQRDAGVATGRKFWLFDSFAGMPRPGDNDDAATHAAYFPGWCVGEPAKVRQAMRLVQQQDDALVITPGWFDATLPGAPIEQIALLHIDADWYDSVKIVLEMLYDRVTPGGFIVLNDYGYWRGCDRAVADFLAERGLERTPIRQIDPKGGAFFQKPLAQPVEVSS